jgi:cytoskeleton protein RodZ
MGETPVLTFGEELRRERLVREVSLEEISAATKISVRLLTALESSDVAKLPAPVFTRGFIRAYARHLGLDPDEKVNAYLADLAPEKSREAGKRRSGPRFLRGRRAAASTIVVTVTAVLLVLGLIARPERRSASASPLVQRRTAPSVSFKNVAVSPGPAPVIQDERAAAVSEKAAVSMELEFEQDSWTEVTTNAGQPIFSGLARRGTRQRFESADGFRLTLGNAGGVKVTVDGRSLEHLGGAGQVVRNLPVPTRLTQS